MQECVFVCVCFNARMCMRVCVWSVCVRVRVLRGRICERKINMLVALRIYQLIE